VSCTALTFLRYFLCAKSCGLNVAIFGLIFSLSGWFQILIMDGWFLLGIVLIFLALCFPVFSLVSATSSYADDIAHIKI
jgi:hypothetical protein